jgi:predicted naringenin-chalcone synthase
MSLAILGMGTAVPPASITQAEATQIARVVCCRSKEQETWLPMLYDHTGIRSRHLLFDQQVIDDMLQGTRLSHSVFLPTGRDDDHGPTTGQRMRQYAANAAPLALCAARQALHQSGLADDEITHLITVSCTGFHAPGVDYELIQGLNLAPTVQRTNIGFMGCHGALNGLRVARAFADAEPDARVLVCAVELCGLHYHYGWDPQKIVANAIFADGAAAVVGAAAAHAAGGAWRVAATGSCLLPDSQKAMSWTIGDHGFEMTLSRRVPGLIREHLRPWLESWLARHGLRIDTVGSWAIHPGGPRILDAIAESLELGADRLVCAREVFAAYGNMSSPTVLFIVEQLRRQQAPRPCVALGFGPGLVAEAVLFE